MTEDWRWRMVLPKKGDYSSVPLNAAGRKAADAWDPAWDLIRNPGGLGVSLQTAPPRVGALKVVTRNMRSGYLRRNGVPYSENAVVTEYVDRLTVDKADWLTVLTIVEDPAYLDQPFITSTHVKREADSSKWSPAPCDAPR